MPLRGCQPLIGGNIFGDILRVVVAGFVSRQRQQPDKRDCQCREENGRGPPDDRRAYPSPPPTSDTALGLEQPKAAAYGNRRRNQREGHRDRDDHAHCARDAQGLERGQPSEAEAEEGSGDSQAGRQDNLRHPVIRGVVSRCPILAGLTCLLIPTEEEYPVVRSSSDPERYQKTDGVGSKTDDLVMAEKRDDSSRHLQFHADHQQ